MRGEGGGEAEGRQEESVRAEWGWGEGYGVKASSQCREGSREGSREAASACEEG